MEIVLENPRLGSSSHGPRPYGRGATLLVTSDAAGTAAQINDEFYPSLPLNSLNPEPIYHQAKLPIQTSMRRIDRSGLLEIVDDEEEEEEEEPSRKGAIPRTVADYSGGLARRIDRSGLLEAVPELPDQFPSKNEQDEEKNVEESKLRTSPKCTSGGGALSCSSHEEEELKYLVESRGKVTTTSSPYLRRYPVSSPGGESASSGLERPIPVIANSQAAAAGEPHLSLFTCLTPSQKFLPPIEHVSRSIRLIATNKNDMSETEIKQHQPDCLLVGESSSRSSEADSRDTLRMSSSIPDVIEAHGSRRDRDNSPVTERAEAEGCEQRQRATDETDPPEDTKIGFNAAKKILHNDNIQTLRVIIMSEQL